MNENRFAGKTVLVTGSSRGIGASIAAHLAEQGARVALTYSSNQETGQRAFQNLKGTGHLLLEMDVSNEESVERAFERMLIQFNTLDYLVNNAGITKDTLLLRMRTDSFDSVINTNLRGTFLCTRAAIKAMLKTKVPGSIVNITSVIGRSGNAGQANYAASKAGIEAFTKSIALEVATRNIRLNCVAPGFIVTEMTSVLTEEQKEEIQQKIPMHSLGSVTDVANAVCFFLSDEASYITGQTLNVNGGMYMD
jgi:3-oxoacyl-[acyl-carrier protein] reductase